MHAASPIIELLQALTMASTSSLVMSPAYVEIWRKLERKKLHIWVTKGFHCKYSIVAIGDIQCEYTAIPKVRGRNTSKTKKNCWRSYDNFCSVVVFYSVLLQNFVHFWSKIFRPQFALVQKEWHVSGMVWPKLALTLQPPKWQCNNCNITVSVLVLKPTYLHREVSCLLKTCHIQLLEQIFFDFLFLFDCQCWWGEIFQGWDFA